jgi:outer membrane protein
MKMNTCKIILGIVLFIISPNLHAQSKIGYISLNDLIYLMPESRKADSSLNEFKQALAQNFAEFQKEFAEKNNTLSSIDTLKFSKAQLEVKRKNLQELYQRLDNYKDEAYQEIQKKQQELVEPIQRKALDAVQQVAKESGYSYVLIKESLAVYPGEDDLLVRTKRKLGLK